jgi:hypothetical protein
MEELDSPVVAVARRVGDMAGNLSSSLPWSLANPRWAAVLNPVVGNPIVAGNLLTSQVLKTGANVINHSLGRKLQGYIVVLNSAAATFYDSQAQNQQPELTLILNTSVPTTVSLYVF